MVIFADVPDHELDELLTPINNYTYPQKSRIYQPGDPPDSVFTIRRGAVKLSLHMSNGSERVVRLLQPGDVMGLESMLDQPYRHTAVSLQPVNACRIPVAVIRDLCIMHDFLRQEVMRRWQTNLDQADHFITELSTGSAQCRMARLLLMLGRESATASSVAFSREDLGAMLGISTETSSRIIAEFKRKALIEERSGKFHYLDVPAIEALANQD